MPDTGIAGYVRLSREEIADVGEPMEQKLALRRSMLVTLARHHSLDLREDQIVCEVKTGGNLSERTGLIEILDRCSRREIHTLICFDVDRLTRDVADWKVISRAFYAGEINLITQRDCHKFNRGFDMFMLQLGALLGEKERRQFSYRRVAANEQRTREGRLSTGYAPYGYRWDKDCQAFRIEAGEYLIAEEIFQRFWTEGAYSIAKSLNDRGVPPPSTKKRQIEHTAKMWLTGTVGSLIRNPFYAGRLAKRHESDREGKTHDLPRASWIWNEAPLQMVGETGALVPLIHPVSFDDWEALQELSSGRKTGAATRGLLTGLLFCASGSPMRQQGPENYTCGCRQKGMGHRAWCIQRPVVERLVWELIAEIVAALPDAPVHEPIRERDIDKLRHRKLMLTRELRENEGTMDELIRRASFYHTLAAFGIERHTEALQSVGKTIETLRGQIKGLQAELDSQEVRRSAPFLVEISIISDFRAFVDAAPFSTQRMIVHLLVKRIDLDPAASGRVRTPSITVSLHSVIPGFDEQRRIDIVNPLAGRPKKPNTKPA